MRRPRIKPVLHPVRMTGNRIRLAAGQYGIGAELTDDADGTIWKLLGLLDGTRDLTEVVDDLHRSTPDLDEQSVREGVQALTESGFVEDAAADPPAELDEREIERYASNAGFFALADPHPRDSPYALQRRLKSSRVSLLGMGGTGCTVAMSLVAAGVGELLCVDFDVVRRGNLNRQLLFTEDDLGEEKTVVAARRLRQLNPHVKVTALSRELTSVDDVLDLMDVDLVVLCADQPFPEIGQWISDAAQRAGTPWLMSMYAGVTTAVGLFIPGRTPCFRCLLANYPRILRQPGPGLDEQEWMTLPTPNVVIAPTAALTGHLAALEAIYHLTGLPTPTEGRIFRQSLTTYDHTFYLDMASWPRCPVCGPPRQAPGGAEPGTAR